MSNNNFFSWIRDGVRQSVIMGVSDAIEQLGTPEGQDPATTQVMAFLGNDTTATKNSGGRRKRLGRSLKDMNDQ